MGISRRTVLAGCSATVLSLMARQAAASLLHPPLALCGRGSDGFDYAFAGRKDNDQLTAIRLPDRGHGPAFSPSGNSIAFPARRPGTFCLVHDTTGATGDRWLMSRAGRHFCGHAVFLDETVLVTTENDYDYGRGMLGIWNTRTGERLGEIESHGIGPHDILPLHQRNAVLVANGGILTHPDTGRTKLNIPTMRPNLSIISIWNSELLAQVEPPSSLHKVSLRHLAKADDRYILVGGQFEGPESENPPLLAVWVPGSPLSFIDMETHERRRMNHYCGSVAIDPSGTYAVATSPRGGIAQILSLKGKPSLIETINLPDICGVAAIGDGRFAVTSGLGDALIINVSNDGPVRRQKITVPRSTKWDNHAGAFILS